VPELPDLAVVSEAFHAALAGRPVISVDAPGPLAVRGTPAELNALVGQPPRPAATRKMPDAGFRRDRIVFSPMLTGRFQLAAPGTPLPTGGFRRRVR
jgi:hypothetical protein